MAKKVTVALTLDSKGFQQGINKAEKSVNDFEQKGTASANRLGTAFAAIASAAVVGKILEFGDAFTIINNKIASVTDTAEQSSSAFNLIKTVANDTRSELGAVGDLFTKLTIATSEMGASQEEVAQITSTFSKALKLAGTDSAGASSAILQFGQAMASGKLSGDEFKSLMETSPVFMRKLADSLDTPIGNLKELASEGILTADVILQATKEMADSVDEEFGDTVPTISESFVVLKNKVIEMFGAFEQNTGLFGKISAGLITLSENLGTVGKVMAIAFGAAVAKNVFTLVKAMQAMNVVTKLSVVLQTARAALMGPAGWAAIAAGVVATGAAMVLMNKVTAEGNELTEKGNDIKNAADADADEREGKDKERTAKQIMRQKELTEAATKQAEEDKKIAERKAERDKRDEDRKAERHAKELLRAQELFEQAQIKLEYDLIDIENQTAKIGLSDVEIEQLETKNELNREREEGLAKIAAMNITDEEKNELMMKLNELYDEQIEKIVETIAATDEQQKMFSTGWTNAWEKYKQDANDNAKMAHDLFNTFAGGMEDAFVKFIETGKLSFKDLINDMLKAIVRFMAKQAVMKFLGLLGGAIGGPLGAVLTGFSASQGGGNDSGGIIGPGSIGLVGEKGPELIKGPAQVIGRQQTNDIFAGGGMGGGVTYNIVANDALSFKQMIMRDPEFIYNATVVGSRRLPQ
jgi:lambda family phage tail tape measure protein